MYNVFRTKMQPYTRTLQERERERHYRRIKTVSLPPPPFPRTIPIGTKQTYKTNKKARQTLLLLPLDKLQRLILAHDDDAAALVPQVPNPVALLRHQQHLRPERRADELAPARLARALRDGFEHVGDGGAVLRVQVGVDFVKEVKGRRVALLDREDEGEGAETCWFIFSFTSEYDISSW